ncbi:MAG: RtcB family protein [Lentisphaerae bacterium]|nr:RtcB family protein [Lentisphaerota bacterium]
MEFVKNDGLPLHIKSWCREIEEAAMAQAENLARHPALRHHVALMPDCHCGIGMPIGGVIAAKDAVIPAAVGVDIGCGMIAVETDIPAEKLGDMRFRRAIHTRIKELIPTGEGKYHKDSQDWEGFEAYLDSPSANPQFVTSLDRHNLGTLGGGNHFIEIQKSNKGFVWIMIHSGSRNLGKRIEEVYQEKALQLCERFYTPLPCRDLAFLPIQDEAGHNYFRDMNFALKYAFENRQRMMAKCQEVITEFIPEVNFLREINIHHNYAAFEEHFGETLCIHRKGATSAKLDETGIIPGSMGTASYIVRGLGNPASFTSCSHGAGRRMSRTVACNTLTVSECDEAMKGIVCDRWHPVTRYGKGKKVPDLSEAPQAYKDIEDVIASESDLVEVQVRLTPLAVIKG